MDRIKDSGSFDWGSTPHGSTIKPNVASVDIMQKLFYAPLPPKMVVICFFVKKVANLFGL